MGELIGMELIAALDRPTEQISEENSDSDLESFHSDDVQETQMDKPELSSDIDLRRIRKTEDFMGPGRLSLIREDIAESAMSKNGSDDEGEMIRLGGTDNFGAVGPFEYEKEMTATNMVGSVQVAIDEAYHNKSSDSLDDLVDPRLTSNEIQQKILLATTPKSKAKAIEHLNLELTLVNQDIQKLSDQVGLHKRSMS